MIPVSYLGIILSVIIGVACCYYVIEIPEMPDPHCDDRSKKLVEIIVNCVDIVISLYVGFLMHQLCMLVVE